MVKNNHPWIMLASVYMTQYIGVAFILSAAVAILRQQNVDLDKLALINLAVLPMIGKVLYASVIDKYSLFFQGKYRSWLIASNTGMVALLFLIGNMDITRQFSSILAIIALYTFFMSIQDVSVDGLSCKLFSKEERKYASSIQFSGNLVGNIIGGGVLLIFYPWIGWLGSFYILSGLTALALIQVMIYREPESIPPTNRYSDKNLLVEVKNFVVKNKTWFVILALYPLLFTWGFALLNPMLVDAGWSLQDIGFTIKVYGSIVGLFSASFAAVLIAKAGRKYAFIGVLWLQTIALSLMVMPAFGFTGKYVVYLAVTMHFASFPAILVISATIFMDKASNSVHKATLFTLQISFSSLAGFIYSSISMTVAKHLGYGETMISGLGISIFIVTYLCSKMTSTENQIINQN